MCACPWRGLLSVLKQAYGVVRARLAIDKLAAKAMTKLGKGSFV